MGSGEEEGITDEEQPIYSTEPAGNSYPLVITGSKIARS
jgi:hypothetical protein